MQRSICAIALVGMLTVVLCDPTDAVAKKRGSNRPFKGSAEGNLIGVVPPSSPTDPTLLIIEYTGEATHLGQFTRTEYLLLDPDGFTFSGFMTFTAANGDELNLDFAGMFISPTDVVGVYELTGGTGRFSDATGTAEFAGFTPDGINVSVTFDGKISY